MVLGYQSTLPCCCLMQSTAPLVCPQNLPTIRSLAAACQQLYRQSSAITGWRGPELGVPAASCRSTSPLVCLNRPNQGKLS